MKHASLAVLFGVGMLATSPALAQVTVDVSKITCDQFYRSKVADPRLIGAWLSGYYQGRNGNTIVDQQVFDNNYDKLMQQCSENPNESVMQALERYMHSGK